MNVMIYSLKKNFDVQKAERWFKERRIQTTNVDLAKHRLGAKELQLFARAAGSCKNLVSQDAKGPRADYVRQLSIEDIIFDELLANPSLIRTPIVRNGNKVSFGFTPEIWESWE